MADGSWVSESDIIVLTALAAVVFIYFYRQRTKPAKDYAKQQSFTTPAVIAAKSKAGSRSFLQKMKEMNKDMVVFYGSQTGTAEDYAGRLAREAKQYGFEPLVADFEDYDMNELKDMTEDKLCFIVVATYGEGEPTDNAQEAYNLYKEEEHEPGCMSHLNYVVFGLGNKTYEQYNAIGKFWDTKLADLGGKRLFELGMGDDDGNLEEDFVTWKEKMWPVVCEHFNKDMDQASQAIVRQFALTALAKESVPENKLYKGEIGAIIVPPAKQTRPPFDIKNPFYAELLENRELMGDGRNCMHLEINIKDTPINYTSGDHVAIFPQNEEGEVNRLAKCLGIEDMDAAFTMTALDPSSPKKFPFPCPTTYRTALTHYLEIMSLPRTHIVKALADYTTEEKEKAHLERLVSSEGKDEFAKYVHDDCRTLAEIMEEHPSSKPPVDLIFELLPRLQCRYYSIASSPKVQPHSIAVCASVVTYTTPLGRFAKGVATNWLFGMQMPDLKSYRLPIFVRKSNFKLPSNAAKPIIMIGPGTGVAPFRAFIQERIWQKQQGREVGPNVLFFGCRYPSEFIYEQELKDHANNGHIELFVAISRADPNKKRYVQHIMAEQKEHLHDLLVNKGGYIYVCGDAKNMARDVNKALADMICQVEGKSEEEGIAFVKKLRQTNRYMEDVWS